MQFRMLPAQVRELILSYIFVAVSHCSLRIMFQPGIALFRPDSARTYAFSSVRETPRMIVNDLNMKAHTYKNMT